MNFFSVGLFDEAPLPMPLLPRSFEPPGRTPFQARNKRVPMHLYSEKKSQYAIDLEACFFSNRTYACYKTVFGD